ncbi:hypothetical protein IWQ62_006770, partial [Dispira parvispora]
SAQSEVPSYSPKLWLERKDIDLRGKVRTFSQRAYTPGDSTPIETNSPIGKADSQKLTAFLSHVYPLPRDEPAEPWVPRDRKSLHQLMEGYTNEAYPEIQEQINATL